jgi:hypothetical protein
MRSNTTFDHEMLNQTDLIIVLSNNNKTTEMVTKTIQFPQQNKKLAKFPNTKRVIAEQELNSPQLPSVAQTLAPSPTKQASSRKPLPESLASSNLAP